ncbi:hypothetical protein CR513_12222, partial [Mucuna pruriens]
MAKALRIRSTITLDLHFLDRRDALLKHHAPSREWNESMRSVRVAWALKLDSVEKGLAWPEQLLLGRGASIRPRRSWLVYVFNHLSPLDMLPLPNLDSMINSVGLAKAKFVKKLHEKARLQIERKMESCAKQTNKDKKQVVFHERDLDRFPTLRKSNLLPKGDASFKVLKHVNDNAYVFDLRIEFGKSTMNLNLRSNSLQEGEDDVSLQEKGKDPTKGDLNLRGPMTRGRLKKLQEKLDSLLAHKEKEEPES